jgi:hypothetical protein
MGKVAAGGEVLLVAPIYFIIIKKTATRSDDCGKRKNNT